MLPEPSWWERRGEGRGGRATSGLRPARTPLLRTDPLSLSFWPFVSTFTWHFLKGDETGDEHSTSDFSLKKRKCHAEKREQISRELVSRPKTWEGQLIWIPLISLDL